jgi:nitroimidazol reductase NimA-like FMN-containing flavoprotein (pyridoxamine 5'-phosphate oxidase superfamily)
MSSFAVTPLNRVMRLRQRGHYDRDTVFRILAVPHAIAHVAWNDDDGLPVCLPMLFGVAEAQDLLYLHGSIANNMLGTIGERGQRVCVTVTVLDAWVLAKSLFHSSANYRSVVLFCTPEELSDDDEKLRALTLISERALPGRSAEARAPTKAELKATSVLKLRIDAASAKVRNEGVSEPESDRKDAALANVWSGTVPIVTTLGTPVKDEASNTNRDAPLPGFLQN